MEAYYGAMHSVALRCASAHSTNPCSRSLYEGAVQILSCTATVLHWCFSPVQACFHSDLPWLSTPIASRSAVLEGCDMLLDTKHA